MSINFLSWTSLKYLSCVFMGGNEENCRYECQKQDWNRTPTEFKPHISFELMQYCGVCHSVVVSLWGIKHTTGRFFWLCRPIPNVWGPSSREWSFPDALQLLPDAAERPLSGITDDRAQSNPLDRRQLPYAGWKSPQHLWHTALNCRQVASHASKNS